MELTNDFRVAVPVERAWAVLTDVELIAPCLPGAQLQEVEGDEYRGIVKVKVGPITAQYKGKATFLSQDDDAHVAVLRAEGRETRGQGNANATITATLTPDGERHRGVGRHRPHDHRQGRPVRPRRAGRRQRQAPRPVRRANLEATVLVDDAGAAPAEAVPVELEDPIEAVRPDAGEPPTPDEPELADAAPRPHDRQPRARAGRPARRRPGTPVARRVAPVLAVIAVAWVLKKLLTRNRD